VRVLIVGFAAVFSAVFVAMSFVLLFPLVGVRFVSSFGDSCAFAALADCCTSYFLGLTESDWEIL